jgi:putative dehydrogenase
VNVGLIGTGEMGAGIGGLLVAGGATVRTSLAGRSAASAERIRVAGVLAVDAAEVAATSEIVLSIVPPDRALEVARAFCATLPPSGNRPLYVDANAIAPATARAIDDVIRHAGVRFLDAGIIGSAPGPGYAGPRMYVAGPDAAAFAAALGACGLEVRIVDGTIGAASALKMSYGGTTKAVTAIGYAMFASAEHAGVGEALAAEFADSQPALHAWLQRQLTVMPRKAYRWVGEMREVATYGAAEPGVATIYEGIAQEYEAIANARLVPGP